MKKRTYLTIEMKKKKVKYLLPNLDERSGSIDLNDLEPKSKTIKNKESTGGLRVGQCVPLDDSGASSSPSTTNTKGHVYISQQKNNVVHMKINPRKRHLHFEILHGNAFLEHLLEESLSLFIIYLYFRGQRVWTQPVPCSSQPQFNEGFLFELQVGELGQTLMANTTQLLNMDDKIHIVLVRMLPSSEKVLVSSYYLDWRHILSSRDSHKKFTVELNGVSVESNVTIGMLEICLTLVPKLVEPLSENSVLSKLLEEKKQQEERDRIFLVYAKTWWKEYLCLNSEHSRRLVKLFQQDENAHNRPVFHFVQVLRVSRPLLELPQEAAWFVALVPFEASPLADTLPTAEQWWVPHTFLCLKKGGSENHASLLCSLLLGFGLDAFVCIGTKIGNTPWAWVSTIGFDNSVTFWESTTGVRYKHDLNEFDESTYPYKTVGCMFNNKSFYANIQETDRVKLCSFNITSRKLWKNMSEDAILSVISSPTMSLMPGWTDPLIHSQEMESELRKKITEYRWDVNLPTRWDVELCHFIAPVLAAYEAEHKMGLAIRKEEINELIDKNIPKGYAFKALPLRVTAVNKKQVFRICLQNTELKNIMLCKEQGCKLALRVHTYVYPENILSIWVIIACKFRTE